MSLRYGLLGLLNYGPMTGYELDKAFKASLSFFWQAKTSQVYRELNAMERAGLLISERVIQCEKPNKRVYTITGGGREELMRWLSVPETDIANAMRVRSAFLMRVFFAGEVRADQSLEMLRAYRAQCLESLKSLESARAASSEYGTVMSDERKLRFWELSILYGKAFYEASLQWADKAITIIEGMQP